MPFDPWSTGIAAGGAALNAFTGASAANASKEQMRRQNQILQRQGQLFGQAQGQYGPLLQEYARRAGIGGYGGQGAGLSGGFGTPEDAARFRAFEEMNNRSAMQNQNRLAHDLAARGIATGSQAAAFAQNERARQGATANFGRQLDILAPQEQERRLGLLQGALGMGFGQGGQASAGYAGQAQQYGNEANQAFAGGGNILQNYMYQRQLGQLAPPAADDYTQQYMTPQQRARLAWGGGF